MTGEDVVEVVSEAGRPGGDRIVRLHVHLHHFQYSEETVNINPGLFN